MKKEHYIAAQDGVKTFVLELIPNGEIKGAPIFCIHGLTRNHKDFEPIFDDLLGLGRKIYAIDVRGRGKSDYDINPQNYNPLIYTQDVINILNVLEIDKAVFIGTSMGGIISMILAAIMPQKVAGMILNDVGPEVCEQGMMRIRNYVGDIAPSKNWNEALIKVKKIALDAYPDKANDNDFWRDFSYRTQKESENGIIFDYDPNIRQNVKNNDENAPAPTLWPQFQMIAPIPIGVIQGAISDILTNDIIEKMKALRPDIIHVSIENTGHAPILNEAKSLECIFKVVEGAA